MQQKRRKLHLKTWVKASLVLALLFCAGVATLPLLGNQSNRGASLDEEVITIREKNPIKKLIHYPRFEDERLNQEITNWLQPYIEDQSNQVRVDYTSTKVWDRYLNIVFSSEVGEEVATYILQYDLIMQQPLDLEDVFRKDYDAYFLTKDLVLDEAFIILEEGIQIDEQIIRFDEHQSYIALQDEHIPSLHQTPKQVQTVRPLDPSKPMIAFTFDDGPRNLSSLTRILDVLEQHDSNATFFVIGELAARFPRMITDMDERGFELGNHTYTHRGYNGKNLDKVVAEVAKTQDTIYEITGEDPKYYRPVGGAMDQTLAEKIPQDIALWTVDSQDWMSRDCKEVVKSTLRYAHDGGVVLFHDIYDSTADAIEVLVPKLVKQGYQIVSLEELEYYHNQTNNMG
ncbi:MAG: polysaccharide deacetylase family protein [Erysipelotrichaceae bacterium]